MILKSGSKGEDVEQLQLKLKAAGYDPGDVDGDYGKQTAAAVLAFQAERPDLDDDGVAGPMTLGALDAAVVRKRADAIVKSTSIVPCDAPTWSAFEGLVASIAQYPVRYGPGRGLWVAGKFIVTYGAGQLNGSVTQWPNVLGKAYPSFHCTSWTNFFLSWLLRRNQDFTHAGNIPSLFDLLEGTPDVHKAPGAGPWRGFGDACFPMLPDGSAVARSGVRKVVDARELYDRRAELPTFVVCGQSTKRASGWNWWHHTVLFVTRDSRLYRIAADGTKGPSSGYSATPMRWTEITEQNVGAYGAAVYRAYGVGTADGSYGDPGRAIAEVNFEA